MTSEYTHGHEYDTYHYEDSKHLPHHFTVTRPEQEDIIEKGSYYHAHPEQVSPSYPHIDDWESQDHRSYEVDYYPMTDDGDYSHSYDYDYGDEYRNDEPEVNAEWVIPPVYHADSDWYN